MSEDPSSQTDLGALRSTWKTLYSSTLPSLARGKDPAQPKWPVTLDHCFARIILDNTIGSSQSENGTSEVVPWDTVIGRPAVRQMNADQLRAAIDLGHRIQKGDADLVSLDRKSLEGRGKSEYKYGSRETTRETVNGVKRKRNDGRDEQQATKSLQSSRKKQSTLTFNKRSDGETKMEAAADTRADRLESLEADLNVKSTPSREEIRSTLKRIDTDKSLTPFRRRLYTSLLSVPRGQYTNYAALAAHLGSVARAVGNGMRNNPFAPDVPCHRVLARDRSIGGFGGDWARDGSLTDKQEKKMELLKEVRSSFSFASGQLARVDHMLTCLAGRCQIR